MVVCLRIADARSASRINDCVGGISLMNPSRLPRGEPKWTCRVWVKESLKRLESHRIISLPCGVDAIEAWCQYTADRYTPMRFGPNPKLSNALVFNDLEWVNGRNLPQAKAHGGGQPTRSAPVPYYGPKPMVTDPTPYYGPKPMITDSTSSYEPKSVTTNKSPYYGISSYHGTKPMVTDGPSYYSRR